MQDTSAHNSQSCQVPRTLPGTPLTFNGVPRNIQGNTDRDEIVDGNIDVYIWISMLTEICSSGFDRLVYEFSYSVDQASICFVQGL